MNIPENFTEIFFFVLIGTPAFLIIYSVLRFKTVKILPGNYMLEGEDEIVPITDLPTKNQKVVIPRNKKLFFIPKKFSLEFVFNHKDKTFLLNKKFPVSLSATIKIVSKEDNHSLESYFQRIKNGKKIEIDYSEMRVYIERALEKTTYFGNKKSFPQFLKSEIAHNTCFNVGNVLFDDFELTILN